MIFNCQAGKFIEICIHDDDQFWHVLDAGIEGVIVQNCPFNSLVSVIIIKF